MSIETTRLLMGTVMAVLDVMEVAAVGLTGLGWCLLGVGVVREARRVNRFAGAKTNEDPPSNIGEIRPFAEYGFEQGLSWS